MHTPNNKSQIFQLLSIGLLQQQSAIDEQNSNPVTHLNPYLKQAWELLYAAFLSEGQPPPDTLRTLINWLYQPLHTWPILGPTAHELGYTQPLLEGGRPTPLCEQIGGPFWNAHDPYLEMQDGPFKEILNTTRQLNRADQYTFAREFIDRHPLLNDAVSEIQANPIWHPTIRNLLTHCYEDIPRSCICTEGTRKFVYCCPRCGWALNWKGVEAFCFEGSVCAALVGDLSEVARKVPYKIGMKRTTEGIQRYVVAPEIELLHIHDRLQKEWGALCSLFPDFDLFDLLVEFPNGNVWAVDFKDYGDPRKLARQLNETVFRWGRIWQRAFYLFPDHRATPDYLQRFEVAWTPQKDVTFLSAADFLALIRKELER